jgi:hypothetical protein
LRKEKRRVSKKKCLDCENFVTRIEYTRCAACKVANNSTDRAHYARDWQLQKKYGITLEEFEAWWIAQCGKCGICGIDMRMPLKKRGQPLDVVAVDHCHKTNKVRGLLCNACNKGLGMFNDNPYILDKARRYLNASDGDYSNN